MQVTSRLKNFSLDSMRVQMDVTSFADSSAIESQPEEGTYVHGLFMEGARWDMEENCIAESRPKELYPTMPVIHIIAVTVDEVKTEGFYTCPIFTTTIRGPTFVFAGPLRTTCNPHKWILAGVALVMQPD
mmetsp:Transcript_17110/g.36237  ORF Transcript_17110/g.36237 Transcript_17110/m.36237 type:complete len:130 (-) Transcript_17110:83-472(-)